MIRKIFAILALTVPLALFGGTPAQAHHPSTAYVANRVSQTVDVIARSHTTGLRFWQYVPAGRDSVRGAEGVFVYDNNKMVYRSLATGITYTSQCGRSYRAAGYLWTGKPYFPIPQNRSIVVIDIYYSSSCVW